MRRHLVVLLLIGSLPVAEVGATSPGGGDTLSACVHRWSGNVRFLLDERQSCRWWEAAIEIDNSTVTEEAEAIKRLKARYFRALDTKQWDELRDVFTDDLVADTTASGGPVVNGADAFVAYLQQTLGAQTTVHQGHMPEIEVTGPTTATGIWALHDIVIFSFFGFRLDGYGHYHETYEKVDGEWRIATLTLTRLHTDLSAIPTE
jgi:hypothetical protein